MRVGLSAIITRAASPRRTPPPTRCDMLRIRANRMPATSGSGRRSVTSRGRFPRDARRRSSPSNARITARAGLALRLGDEQRDAPRRLGLVLLVGRKRCDRELPQPGALGVVAHLPHLHRLHLREVADLDGGVRAQVVDPDGVGRRPTHRAHEHVTGTVGDAHQRSLADRARLVAGVRDDDDGQAGVAQRRALRPTATLVELDLVAHPLPGAGNVLGHGSSSCRLRWLSVNRYWSVAAGYRSMPRYEKRVSWLVMNSSRAACPLSVALRARAKAPAMSSGRSTRSLQPPMAWPMSA